MADQREKQIVFIDTEVSKEKKQIVDMAILRWDGMQLHTKAVREMIPLLEPAEYLCGHNILQHDLPCLLPVFEKMGYQPPQKVIDTLCLSPLLFPAKPYHHLPKDEKMHEEEDNNPLTDCIKDRDRLLREVEVFNKLDEPLKQIFYGLLGRKEQFRYFFDYIGYAPELVAPEVVLVKGRISC